jgi:hypothetical protein
MTRRNFSDHYNQVREHIKHLADGDDAGKYLAELDRCLQVMTKQLFKDILAAQAVDELIIDECEIQAPPC